MKTIVFETERMIARHLVESDVDSLYAVYSDPVGCRWVGDGKPITMEQCVQWVEVTRQNYKKRGYGMYAVDCKETGGTVGFCGLVHPGNQEAAELKYALRSECWGKGLASELALGALTYGTQQFQLDRVIATIAPENNASIRVACKIGMNRLEPIREVDGSLIELFEYRSDRIT
jgi:RimJ/RimL family protein N-acetyltransferase